jgi:hypothetical protein
MPDVGNTAEAGNPENTHEDVLFGNILAPLSLPEYRYALA